MKVTAIIQARMTSSRLPGKVLKTIYGKPLLSYMVERVKKTRLIDRIIIATTTNSADDVIELFAEKNGLLVFRGSEQNVLERFYLAASEFDVKHVMRLTADCPLIDHYILDELIKYYFTNRYDYASNCLNPSLPDGLDAEVFSKDVLQEVYSKARLPSQLEHVTPYIYQHQEQFKIGSWRYSHDLSNFRLTVDEPEDFVLVGHIISSLYKRKNDFNLNDIIIYLNENPELVKINAGIKRNEGFLDSLQDDEQWLATSSIQD